MFRKITVLIIAIMLQNPIYGMMSRPFTYGQFVTKKPLFSQGAITYFAKKYSLCIKNKSPFEMNVQLLGNGLITSPFIEYEELVHSSKRAVDKENFTKWLLRKKKFSNFCKAAWAHEFMLVSMSIFGMIKTFPIDPFLFLPALGIFAVDPIVEYRISKKELNYQLNQNFNLVGMLMGLESEGFFSIIPLYSGKEKKILELRITDKDIEAFKKSSESNFIIFLSKDAENPLDLKKVDFKETLNYLKKIMEKIVLLSGELSYGYLITSIIDKPTLKEKTIKYYNLIKKYSYFLDIVYKAVELIDASKGVSVSNAPFYYQGPDLTNYEGWDLENDKPNITITKD